MIKRFEHGGNIYEAPPPGKVWLDFSANINPLGLSPAVMASLTAGESPRGLMLALKSSQTFPGGGAS